MLSPAARPCSQPNSPLKTQRRQPPQRTKDRRSRALRFPLDPHDDCLRRSRAPFSFPNGCTTNLQQRQRFGHDLPCPHPASIRIRPALRSRAVRALVYGIFVSARASEVMQTLRYRLSGIAAMPAAPPTLFLTDSEDHSRYFGTPPGGRAPPLPRGPPPRCRRSVAVASSPGRRPGTPARPPQPPVVGSSRRCPPGAEASGPRGSRWRPRRSSGSTWAEAWRRCRGWGSIIWDVAAKA